MENSMAELKIEQDALRDTITVNGVRYARPLFEDLAATMQLGQPFELVSRKDGVVAIRRLGDSDINRPATIEEAQHAAEIGACLPNGVMWDYLGNPRVRFVRVSLDGSHLIQHADEIDRFKAGEDDPDQYTYTDVYLSQEEFDALPEFDGF
jgi:hypothetical protein